jgi:hypothetical protein
MLSASSKSMTGMSSFMGYKSLQVSQIRPLSVVQSNIAFALRAGKYIKKIFFNGHGILLSMR